MTAKEDLYIKLGFTIRKARVKAKLTQQQLSDSLGISRTSLTNIEKGNQRLLVHTLFEFAEALNIKPEKLIASLDSNSETSSSLQATSVPAKKKSEFLASILNRSRKKKNENA